MPTVYCLNCGAPNEFSKKKPSECADCGKSFTVSLANIKSKKLDYIYSEEPEYHSSELEFEPFSEEEINSLFFKQMKSSASIQLGDIIKNIPQNPQRKRRTR